MKSTRRPIRRAALSALLVAAWVLGSSSGPSYAARQAPPDPMDEYRDKIQYLSGVPMLLMAEALGVTEIAGKPIDVAGSPPGRAKPKKLRDVGIGVHPTKHENEPTVVTNPRDKKKLVAGSHFFGPPAPEGNRCVAYRSSDSGATWSAPFALPQLTSTSFCSDPVLAYAPDGSRVYYAYMDIKFDFTPNSLTIDLDILVSFSDNNGATWTGPVVALDGEPTIIIFDPFSVTPGFEYDKPWIGTHVDQSQSTWVYVTATRFDDFEPFDCHIAFARSDAKGVTSSWSSPTLLDSSSDGCGNPVVVQGSRPAGGRGGDVLVAWYNSGTDGWLTDSFQIRTRRSGNHGATWNSPVNAAVDSFEAPFFLGPDFFYHRWWGTMFPDVEIDPGGGAHIVYTHDPEADFSSPEDGDIRYISSSGSPYNAWSSPVTVNDDGLERAQGYAALETQYGGQASILHAIWEDHRLSPEVPTDFPNSSNLFYDMFYSRKVPGQGVGWMENFRVSDTSSINDFIFIGDYNDLTTNDTLLFGVWTDRRHQTDIFAFEDNVFGSRIIAGGGTP